MARSAGLAWPAKEGCVFLSRPSHETAELPLEAGKVARVWAFALGLGLRAKPWGGSLIGKALALWPGDPEFDSRSPHPPFVVGGFKWLSVGDAVGISWRTSCPVLFSGFRAWSVSVHCAVEWEWFTRPAVVAGWGNIWD